MTDDTHSRTRLPGLAQAGANGTAPPALDPRRWAALVVILVAGVMDLLDATIVNVAAPSILKDLQATYAQFEWVVVFSEVTPPGAAGAGSALAPGCRERPGPSSGRARCAAASGGGW